MNGSKAIWQRRWARWTIVCVLGIGLLLLAFDFWLQAQIDSQLDSIRIAGEPAASEDLEWFYPPVPSEDDSTDLWLEAFALLESADATYSDADARLPFVVIRRGWPIPGEPFATRKLAETYLDSRRKALHLIYRAVALGGRARYPLEPVSPPSAIPYDGLFTRLRTALPVLELQALVCAHRGDARGAGEALYAMLALGRSVDGFPDTTVAGYPVVVIACATNLAIRIMPVVPFGDGELQRWQKLLREVPVTGNLRVSLCSERLRIIEGASTLVDAYSLPWYYRLRHVWCGNLLHYLDAMSKYTRAAQAPWPQALAQARATRTEFDDRAWFPYRMSQAALSQIPNRFEYYGIAMFRVRGFESVIGIERFRRKHGRLPATLDDLVPEFLSEVPLDPFSGATLLYRFADDRYAVYSVGSDGQDDGGHEIENSRGPDIVIEVRLAQTLPAP